MDRAQSVSVLLGGSVKHQGVGAANASCQRESESTHSTSFGCGDCKLRLCNNTRLAKFYLH